MTLGIIELDDNYNFDTPVSYRQIVRCGECKKANTSECSLAYWDDDWGKWRIGYAGDNWYCADGERSSE